MKARLIATIIAALIAAPAVAHHSFAMFDTAREVELRNLTVKQWQWTSPHTWLFAEAANGDRYTLEGGNPGLMRRQGFAKGSFRPGMRVTVYMAPLRNGQKGGAINAVTLPDGRTLGERKR